MKMASSMTSHATIGNSTFAEPRSAETTMSSIEGPSDFTENLFDYMKGNKKPTARKQARIKSKFKSKRKLHLKPEESGIIIESPSEFSDDTNDYMACGKAMSSPAKSDKSDLDGPSDFTANIVDYVRGSKAYSPPAKTSAKRVLGTKAVERAPTVREESVCKVDSPPASTSLQQHFSTNAAERNSTAQERVVLSVSESASLTEKTGSQKRLSINADKNASAKQENVVEDGNSTLRPAAKKQSEVAASKTTASPTIQLEKGAAGGTKPSPKPDTASSGQVNDNEPSPLPRVNKNLVINGPSDFTASLAAFINGTKAASAPLQTTSRPKLTERPMSSPAKGENFDINGASDFTANLAGHINGTKKQPVPADNSHASKTSTRKSVASGQNLPVGKQATKAKPSLKHGDSELGGPSDFTENLVDYIKGTKAYSPHSKTSSSATIAAAVNPIDSTNKEGSKAVEEDLRVQIAQLQARLLQKNDTITGLQSSLAAAEKKWADLESEAEEKNATIDKLQISLKQSNQQCQGLEVELHQMKMEVDDLQENLNVSAGSDLDHRKDGADGHPKDVIINTVQHKDRVINRLHHNHETLSGHVADLRAEIADKDLLLIENVEEIRKPQSEKDCELLKDTLSKYADELNSQHEISDHLAAENKKLGGIVASLQRRQTEVEEKQEQREAEWQARAELLMEEIDRRGAACMQLWGQLEHPGQRDAKGRQKYTYKYTEKSSRVASVF
jgi:hypothetical protein